MTPEGKTKSLVDRLLKKRGAWFSNQCPTGMGVMVCLTISAVSL